MKEIALCNGRVCTPRGVRDAILVRGQNIAFTGSTEAVLARSDSAERVDLGGRLVLPGFIDGHMHFISHALSLEQADLTGCRSISEVRARVMSFMNGEEGSSSEWVSGRGWNHELFNEGRIFTRTDIDDLLPNRPALLTRVCGHVAVLNSAALSALGISGDSRFPGGVVDLDPQGLPTGVIRESAVEWVRSRMPLPGPEKLRRLVARGGEEASKAGLTSIHSDDLGSVGGDFRTIMDLYISLDREGNMPVRITEQLLLRDRRSLDDFLATGWRTGDGSPSFHIGPLKILTDGSMGGRTALLREEYADSPGVFGVPIYSQEDLDDLVWTAHRAGMQVAAHAIGDGALEMCLRSFGRAQELMPRAARHYIVHCQMGDMGQYRRMAGLGLGAAIQPPFVPSDRPMAMKRIGEKRAMDGYAWKTLLDLGIFLSGGSDCPVETCSPIWGIHAAVTRQDGNGFPAGGWNPGEKLSVAEAVDLYTRGGAYASFEEHRKGVLEEGKAADLAVLDRDILSIPEEDIQKATVVLTMCGGRITFRGI